jgi:hypothetical protein
MRRAREQLQQNENEIVGVVQELLPGHCSRLDIQLLSTVVDITARIPAIQQDTTHIRGLVQEIQLVRLQVSSLEPGQNGGGLLLQRFPDDSIAYAETVIGSEPEEPVEEEQDTIPTLSDIDTSPVLEDVYIAIMGRKGVGKSTFIS